MNTSGNSNKDDLIDEREMIGLIKMHPEVYNTSHPNYRRLESRNAAWKEIADELNTKPIICKNRWKTIRNVLKRDFSTNKKQEYYLKDALQFYIPFLKFEKKYSERKANNNSVKDYETEEENPTPSKFSPHKRKSFSSQASMLRSTNTDVDKDFLYSMLPDLETLDARRKRIFKEKVQSWLRELHDDMDIENSEQVTHEYAFDSSTNIEYLHVGEETIETNQASVLQDHAY